MTPYQQDTATLAMLRGARDTGRAEGYAVGHYDGVRAWMKATAPLLAIAFGGGIVFAIVVVGWWPK